MGWPCMLGRGTKIMLELNDDPGFWDMTTSAHVQLDVFTTGRGGGRNVCENLNILCCITVC